MNLIRVCQLITELQPGGAERCVYELATRLDGEMFDVQVAALRGGAFVEKLESAGVKVSVLDIGGKFNPLLPLKLRQLVKWLRTERIDLLHTHLFHADLAGRLAARKAGVGHLVHTVHVAERRFRPWQFAFARWARRRCERIVCVSPSVMQWHSRRSRLPDACYEVIANGIDVDAFGRDDAARRRLRSQWGIGEGDPVAVFVGRLDPQKGIDVLLAAAERLAARGSSLRIVIAGDGPQRGRVERFCRSDAGRLCRHLGFAGDVAAVLSAADFFVLPSRWEGWPLALGEAMAAGLAAVAADVPGICDVLVDGQTGVMVPSEDPGKLADAMAMMAADERLRETLAAAGQRRIRDEFSIQTNVARHARLYQELARAGAPRSGSETSETLSI